MLSDVDCRALAEHCQSGIAQQCGEELVLMPSPFETSATLAYTYQTTEYVATGNFIHAMAGNGPILVSKLTGAVKVAGTALPIEDYIHESEGEAGRSAHGCGFNRSIADVR